jgi:hypothetical protein
MTDAYRIIHPPVLGLQGQEGRLWGPCSATHKTVALCNLYGKNDNYMEKRPTPEHRLVADEALPQHRHKHCILPMVGW